MVFNSSLYAIAACSLGAIESMVRLKDGPQEMDLRFAIKVHTISCTLFSISFKNFGS